MSNGDKRTDFGATLDLCASKKDNCSVDNHAILCIFFVLTNWRKVKYKIGENEYSETIINDCDNFFGSTLSRGKKNDHVFHNACLSHLIKFYNDERTKQGKGKIPINIVHTDNCAPQYKYRQQISSGCSICNNARWNCVA